MRCIECTSETLFQQKGCFHSIIVSFLQKSLVLKQTRLTQYNVQKLLVKRKIKQKKIIIWSSKMSGPVLVVSSAGIRPGPLPGRRSRISTVSIWLWLWIWTHRLLVRLIIIRDRSLWTSPSSCSLCCSRRYWRTRPCSYWNTRWAWRQERNLKEGQATQNVLVTKVYQM